MKQSKRYLSFLLLATMLFTLGAQPVLAADVHMKVVEPEAAVLPVEYEQVATKIAAAQEETVVKQGTDDIHYYWNTDSFVVKDSSGYYSVEINESFTQFVVNGKTFDITKSENNVEGTSVAAVTYPTPWSTMHDTTNTFDVGGLPYSVVGGLIGTAIGTMLPGGAISAIGGNVVGALAGMFIGGIFPSDYNITVKFLQRYRFLEPTQPTVMEFYERTAVYGGPSNNLYKTQLYYDTNTYTREFWD